MLRVGDFVMHQQTGDSGIVVGYGHQIVDGILLSTLIVQLAENTGLRQRGFVEDLSLAWMPIEKEQYSQIACFTPM